MAAALGQLHIIHAGKPLAGSSALTSASGTGGKGWDRHDTASASLNDAAPRVGRAALPAELASICVTGLNASSSHSRPWARALRPGACGLRGGLEIAAPRTRWSGPCSRAFAHAWCYTQ